MASRVAARRLRIFVGSGKRGDEEGPAREPEELDDGGQYADRRRYRDDLELVASQHLAEQDRERREQNCGEHEAVPGQLQSQAAGVEAAEDVADRTAEHGWVLEEATQEEEEDVERDREPDQQGPRRTVKAQDAGACDSVLTEHPSEEKAGHECVEEHAAGAEVRESLVDVRRDHVRS